MKSMGIVSPFTFRHPLSDAVLQVLSGPGLRKISVKNGREGLVDQHGGHGIQGALKYIAGEGPQAGSELGVYKGQDLGIHGQDLIYGHESRIEGKKDKIVKEHCGHAGNDAAGYAAKDGIRFGLMAL